MKIVIPGGTGQVGRSLARSLVAGGHEVVVLSRTARDEPWEGARVVAWDGRTLGDWAQEVDRADAVINLAGRTVNCRYTEENLRQMLDSRVESTQVVGQAIAQAERPPRVWLQMSTATIYAHRFDAANDEDQGLIGGDEPDAPAYWKRSIEIAQAWERAAEEAPTPSTRKVLLRTAMVMTPEPGGIFAVLYGLVRWGLGGSVGGGRQYVSWIHEHDFLAVVALLLEREEVSGPVNLAAPGPLPFAEFMRALRSAAGAWIGLPATAWMAEIGAWVMRTDTELLLKSRRVVSSRLAELGYEFRFPDWAGAASDLVARHRAGDTSPPYRIGA